MVEKQHLKMEEVSSALSVSKEKGPDLFQSPASGAASEDCVTNANYEKRSSSIAPQRKDKVCKM